MSPIERVLVAPSSGKTHLRSGTAPWTILPPGFFAQNFGDAYRRDIVEDDRVFVPAGKGRVAFVDVRDLGAVATRVFLDPGPHQGHGLEVTGGKAITFDEATRLLSDTAGREISCQPASVGAYVAHLRRRGLPAVQIAVQTVLHLGLRRGGAARTTAIVEDILGRPPRTMREYFEDHRERWEQEDGT